MDGQAGRQRAGAVVRRKHRGDDQQPGPPLALPDANLSPGATITPAAPAPAPAARPKRNPRPRGIRVVGDWVG